MDSVQLRVGLLNLDWMKRSLRRAQAQRLAALNLDLLCVTEIHAPDVATFAADGGFAWSRCCVLPDDTFHGRPALGVAILGGSRVQWLATHQLSADDFLADNAPLDATGLPLIFHRRQIAVDVRVGPDCSIRVGAFGAPPGTGKDPDTGKLIGYRKPWFAKRVAEWVATWPSPHLFAIDANAPQDEGLDPAETVFVWPRTRTGSLAGEELLMGAPEQVVHDAHDLWRRWLDCPDGATDRALVPEGGPLAHSYIAHGRAPKWRRYDQIWGSAEVRVMHMRYDYDLTLSDHALVTVTVEVRPAVGASGAALGDTRRE